MRRQFGDENHRRAAPINRRPISIDRSRKLLNFTITANPCRRSTPEVVEDLDGRPLEHRCDVMSDLSEQHDACHGNVVGRDAAEPGQQLDGADKLAAVQPPGEGDQQLGCLALGRAEEAMRQGHALFLLAWTRCPSRPAHPMPL